MFTHFDSENKRQSLCGVKLRKFKNVSYGPWGGLWMWNLNEINHKQLLMSRTTTFKIGFDNQFNDNSKCLKYLWQKISVKEECNKL